ncbi:hypothetical protein K438DRAFT_1982466 [Mycena galopus ATCC 62051]|nr:hypothetical protein K438DRAFT_1982466 [Mycena galopus ATCC 62051]
MDARRSQSLSRSSLSCLGPETDASDTLLDAATGLLRMAPKDSKRSWLKSTRILSFLSVALHSTLVVIHLLLMVVWWRGIEHRLVFPVEDQTVVSSVVTAILTTFIYSAALVFVTQKLSFRRSLRREQTLSATHDIATAWGGIASAALCVWNQKVVPAAITGVFSAFVYLANILVLHITSPALLSVGTFNATRSYSVPTQGLPAFNFSGYNLSSDDDLTNALASAPDYATASLSFLTYLNRNSTNFGLHAGTLYDVLGGNGGPVDATVNATGFNLTCGYLTNVTANFDSIGDSVYWSFNISGTSTTYLLESIEPGIISTFKMASVVHGDMETAYTATFYSTVPILDSEDNGGHWVALDPPMESVHQTAMVNSQSRLPISFAPEITKNASTWLPFTAAIYNFSDAIFGEPEGLINAWEPCYSAMPAAPISISDGLAEESVADMFLREQLHLFPFNSTTPASITLHDLENTFSNLAAAMFWTLGHNPPLPVTGYDSRLEVSLIEGNAAVTELFLEAHLNLSIIAVVSGLAASAILLFLSLQSVRLRKGGERETDGAIDGVGMLHAIWLYRNHPELKTRLEPVDHPTDTNLREAAMVRTRLSRSLFHPHRSWELTELKPEHMHETTSLVGDENAMTVSVSHSMLPEKSTYTGHDTDFLTSPNTTPNLAPISREAPARSWSKSTGTLSLFSVALHVIFVAIHVALVVVWWRELEQRLVFPLEKQGSVSFIITTIVTTIVAIYSAVLVFLTQKMSFRRSLCVNQTLTATHDNVAAWGGIGSAAFCIWDQQAVPASVTGALSVFVYLANILFLHITSPVLLSVQTFNFTQSVPVSTQSLPAFNFSGYDLSSNEDRVNALTSAEQYAAVSLPFLPYLNERTTNPGLGIGTLYDVLNPNPGTGNAYVNAVGFNITCGYLDLNVTQNPDFSLEFSVDGVTYWVGLTSSGVISTPSLNKRQISVAPIVLGGRHASEADAGSTSSQSKVPILPVIFYSTIPILDSNNNTGPPVILDPPMMFTNVSVIQFFRCSQALVHGTAIVDSQSGQLISAETTLNKAAATWLPFPENTSISSDSVFVEPEGFIIAWESWYCAMPMGSVHLTSFSWDSDLSVADLFLMQQLNLIPSNGTVPDHVTLHDLENQLSHLIASMFWILGHVAPPPGFNATTATSHDVAMPPVLLTGNSTVTEISVQARVNLSIIAVSAGLFASATLLLLSLRISRFRKAGTHEYDVQIDGAGMLHAIWLYCGHPELETLIEQVEDPTDVNLREAGMVTTRFGVPEASS